MLYDRNLLNFLSIGPQNLIFFPFLHDRSRGLNGQLQRYVLFKETQQYTQELTTEGLSKALCACIY